MKYTSLAIAHLALLLGSTQADAQYLITPITTPNAAYIEARHINNVGQVVGYVRTNDNVFHATRWGSDGSATYLDIPGMEETVGYGINDAGQVAGYAYDGQKFTAIVWTGNTAKALDAPPGRQAIAAAINERGDVAGYVAGGDLVLTWSQGQVSSMPSNLGYATVKDMSNTGRIAATVITSHVTPAVWIQGTSTQLPYVGEYAWVDDVNERGQMVGGGQAGRVHFWDENGVLTLGPEHSYAGSINNLGQVVGSIEGRPTLWENGVATDISGLLDAQGWSLTTAGLINDVGQIYGYATYQGMSYNVLLTPVPEPGSAAMILLGLGCLGVGAWQRRRIWSR